MPTAEESAATERQYKQEYQRLYQIMGDRSLSPAQLSAVVSAYNSHFCYQRVP
jgi:hypothetical protein